MSGVYSVQVAGLREGRYNYDFEIDNAFFEGFEESEIREGDLAAFVEIDRKSTHFDVSVTIKGEVLLPCDRCLGDVKIGVETQNRFIVKPGEEWDGDDPDIMGLPGNGSEIDFSQHFYDFINLALPIQRKHNGKPGSANGCDPEMIKRLNELSIDSETESDSRWDDLKKLKGN